MSAKGDIHAIARKAAVGDGNPPILDPSAGFPNHPFFDRKLRFVSASDTKGRIRLCALTVDE
ncbi:hypothetical protein HWB51_gp067 [Mycobacterium phage Cuke]|uniref:Uncharacterized protein n=1 Tax=Mycobacterium phage Cuke TaxID=2079417 RepID=A0A2L1IX62_9CAUD|nr:hypothetical protein HWB51_gp067 [Mycobacterium phage Cuke]AVD99745.1 hypothetical protein SEA_CUKE_129 [Mycobacterium phage Cuke]